MHRRNLSSDVQQHIVARAVGYNSVQQLAPRASLTVDEGEDVGSQQARELLISARSESAALHYASNNMASDSRMTQEQPHMERMRYLDNYRLICEKRIRDLAPSHPLPVLPSHCGKPNPDLEEYKTRLLLQQQLMQETTNSSALNSLSSELIQLRSQNEYLVQEKNQIEGALRHETLANEEQRNYIQILRNAVDQKMENLGL